METSVFPTATSGRKSRCRYRYSTAAERKWFGFISPADAVTMPWRSASVSLAKATSKRSFRATSRAIA